MAEDLKTACIKAGVSSREFCEKHGEVVLFALGVALLYAGSADLAHAGQGSFSTACDKVLQLAEGAFGALVCSVAGVAAIVAAAMGGFKMAWTLVVVSVGSFILRSYVGLFNGVCGGGGGAII